MSLINDALKRAKDVDANNPPPASDSLHLRPAEPATPAKKGVGLVLPATAVTVGLAALFSFWQLRGGNHTSVPPTTDIAARSTSRTFLAATPQVEPANSTRRASAITALSNSNSPSALKKVPETAETNTAVMVQAEPPKPAPPQLRAIIFNPTRPSALIDSKTVFVGDKIREFRVIAITPVSATLASVSQTNVLTLE